MDWIQILIFKIIDLLEPFKIAFGDKIYEGTFKVGEHKANFTAGTSITKFPKSANNYLLYRDLIDQGDDFLSALANKTSNQVVENVPIIGFTQVKSKDAAEDAKNSGRIVVYGDSNCIDSGLMNNGWF